MVRYTLKQCAYFLAVADAGGIAQAAKALNISQPAVAQALDKLEELTGLRLFHRYHARGLELTAQGRAFEASARRLLALAGEVERDAEAIAAGQSGRLRLGCFHTLAPFVLVRLVAGFQAGHPGVEIAASEERQDELTAGLAEDRLDLALLYDMQLDAVRLDWQVLLRLAPMVLLPATHRLAGRAAIALEELAGTPFVTFDGPGSRDYFAGVLERQGVSPPVAFASSSQETVRSAVANGLGFSLTVMRPKTAETYDGGRVTAVPIAGDSTPLQVVLAHRRGRGPEAIAANFAAYCGERIAELM